MIEIMMKNCVAEVHMSEDMNIPMHAKTHQGLIFLMAFNNPESSEKPESLDILIGFNKKDGSEFTENDFYSFFKPEKFRNFSIGDFKAYLAGMASNSDFTTEDGIFVSGMEYTDYNKCLDIEHPELPDPWDVY